MATKTDVSHGALGSLGIGKRTLVAVAVLGAAAGAVVLARTHSLPVASSTAVPSGESGFHLEKLTQAGTSAGAAVLRLPSGTEAAAQPGAALPAGAALKTDARSRAILAHADGARLALDRATSATLRADEVALDDGTVQLDVGAAKAPYAVRVGDTVLRSDGGAFVATKLADAVVITGLRGTVAVSAAGGRVQETVSAGQEATLKDGRLERALARPQNLAWEADAESVRRASGLGELKAKKPGAADSTATALRIAKHDVRAKVAGAFARTEIEEVFANDSDDVLEGIYRFRLPRGATIERLALDVDGQLIEGEFIDKAKAGKIWKGVIWNATAKRTQPKDEIVWVPGPWHDPALLDWSEDGIFTLKIYPIPKRGSRRLILAYTERLPEVHGQREYRYPLPEVAVQGANALKLGEFSLDLQVAGHDRGKGAKVEHYAATVASAGEDTERVSFAAKDFAPEGDMVVRYTLPDEKATVRAYGYEGDDGARYVAMAVKPDVPAFAESKPRDVLLVVDSGRAMTGERYAEARALARSIADGLDRRDRVDLVTCDLWCRPRKGGWLVPGAGAAAEVDAQLAALTPDGASDLEAAVLHAAQGKEAGRERVVVVISSGAGAFGASHGARLGTALGAREDLHVIVAPVGTASATRQLGDLSTAAAGVLTRAEPDASRASTNVLRALAGRTLRHPELVLPEGLSAQTPGKFVTMLAGDEMFVVAKADRSHIDGVVTLKGNVGGEPYERTVPLRVDTVKGGANAFVPRMFATARADELWTSQRPEDRIELVALSQKWHVPSPYTSLLVLESEAMFKAFGIDRTEHAVAWTGEQAAIQSTGTDEQAMSESTADEESAGTGGLGKARGPMALGGGGSAQSFDGDLARDKKEAKSAEWAPPAPAAEPAAKPKASSRAALNDALSDEAPPRDRWGRPMMAMRRTWVRTARISLPQGSAISPSALADARRALQDKPDSPLRHATLARLLQAAGPSYDGELDALLANWEKKDAMDPDLLDVRADRAAARGQREEAMRIRSGIWSGTIDDAARIQLADRLAASAGSPSERCRFQTVSALLDAKSKGRAAQALACNAADAQAELRSVLEASGLPKGDLPAPSTSEAALLGDFVAKASWSAPVDLDLVLIGPDGRRYDLTARHRGVTVRDARLVGAEQLAVSARGKGVYSLHVMRADAGTTPVDGRIELRANGAGAQTLPFALAGRETEVARIDVGYKEVLVPYDF